jgi:alkylation response protein AidB-like acyl-CoA dehydrogenase
VSESSAAAVFTQLVESGRLDLPLPGGGSTARRWRMLAAIARADLSAAKLAEAHADADAILDELGAQRVKPGERWAVWAAEPPNAVVRARLEGDQWLHAGTKSWCSGARVCTHALITAAAEDGPRLFAVDLRHAGVRPSDEQFWHGPAMVEAGTTEVGFQDVPAVPIGQVGEYLTRPGFWQGAIGIAAVWLGGAGGLARALAAKGRGGGLDPHALAHLGAVDAVLFGAWAALDFVARGIDDDSLADRRIDALRCRAIAEAAAVETQTRVGRALGPGPMAKDAVFAALAADLPVYLRQSHAERDLQALGDAVSGDENPPW